MTHFIQHTFLVFGSFLVAAVYGLESIKTQQGRVSIQDASMNATDSPHNDQIDEINDMDSRLMLFIFGIVATVAIAGWAAGQASKKKGVPAGKKQIHRQTGRGASSGTNSHN